ncbi:MAG: nitrile hydratase subunit alpha [Pseudomonadota bacterium]
MTSHDHGHEHAPIESSADENHPDALTTRALKELLIEKGWFSADDVRRQIEVLQSPGPHQGAAIVARAWVDPDYRTRLLADGSAAAAALGYPIKEAQLIVVENTDETHNLVTCTLCSCYPRSLLGQPPAWYTGKAYRARSVHDPRGVMRELGWEPSEDLVIRVHDSTADMRYLVLPRRPDGTEGWTEEALASLVSRDSMIGVAPARAPDDAA